MNPITDAVASSEFGWLLGGLIIWSTVVFLGWAVWAWLPSNREALERAGRLPLEDGDAQ